MAHTITGHTIVNGSRNLILQFNIQSDGASGQYSNYELFNLDDYTGEDRGYVSGFKVAKVTSHCSVGAAVELKFGSSLGQHKTFYLTPINTADGSDKTQEWEGGLSPLLTSSDNTIRLTSLGLDASGDWMTIVLWLKKKRTTQSQA